MNRRGFLKQSTAFGTTGLLMGTATSFGAELARQAVWGKVAYFDRFLDRKAKEFQNVRLKLKAGSIPKDLQGTLYRNGPLLMQRNGRRVGHLFDGDGGVLKVSFENGEARASYAYIRHPKFDHEEKHDRFIYQNFGTEARNPFYRNFLQVKNPHNTSLLSLNKRLYALAEGGLPFELDSETLEPIGPSTIQGSLPPERPDLPSGGAYSAHPVVDRETGITYGFGVLQGFEKNVLNLYKHDPEGNLITQNTIDCQAIIIHDACKVGDFLVFADAPLTVNMVSIALGLEPLAKAMHWKSGEHTRLLIVDCRTLQLVQAIEAPAFFCWHFCAGKVLEDNTLEILLVKIKDFKANHQWLAEYPSGQPKTSGNNSRLSKIWIKLDESKVEYSEDLLPYMLEMPTKFPASSHPLYQKSFMVGNVNTPPKPDDFFDTVFSYDRESEELQIRPFPAGMAHEAIPCHENTLLAPVHDTEKDEMLLYGLEASDITSEAQFVLEIPSYIPWSFHGIWVPKP